MSKVPPNTPPRTPPARQDQPAEGTGRLPGGQEVRTNGTQGQRGRQATTSFTPYTRPANAPPPPPIAVSSTQRQAGPPPNYHPHTRPANAPPPPPIAVSSTQRQAGPPPNYQPHTRPASAPPPPPIAVSSNAPQRQAEANPGPETPTAQTDDANLMGATLRRVQAERDHEQGLDAEDNEMSSLLIVDADNGEARSTVSVSSDEEWQMRAARMGLDSVEDDAETSSLLVVDPDVNADSEVVDNPDLYRSHHWGDPNGSFHIRVSPFLSGPPPAGQDPKGSGGSGGEGGGTD